MSNFANTIGGIGDIVGGFVAGGGVDGIKTATKDLF